MITHYLSSPIQIKAQIPSIQETDWTLNYRTEVDPPSFHTKSRTILARGSMETDKEVLDGTTDLGPVTLTPNIAIIFLYEKEQGPLPGTGVID